MDFAVFSKTEIEEMFQTMMEHMPENMRNIAIKEFGSIEQWKKHYMEVVSSEKMQKGYAKVVGEYGFVMKQFSQIKEEKGFMLAQAQYYRNEKIKPMTDEKYGDGASDFFAQAIEAFYGKE